MGKRSTILLLVLFFGGLGALWWARWADVPTANDREAMADRVVPAPEDGNAVHERAPRTDNQSGPVA